MESYDILYTTEEKGVGFCVKGKKDIINMLFVVSSLRHSWLIQVKFSNLGGSQAFRFHTTPNFANKYEEPV